MRACLTSSGQLERNHAQQSYLRRSLCGKPSGRLQNSHERSSQHFRPFLRQVRLVDIKESAVTLRRAHDRIPPTERVERVEYQKIFSLPLDFLYCLQEFASTGL